LIFDVRLSALHPGKIGAAEGRSEGILRTALEDYSRFCVKMQKKVLGGSEKTLNIFLNNEQAEPLSV
jgi:hypothetical protein